MTVTILLRKVARCILGTRNWVLTLLRRQRKKHFLDQLWEAGLFVFNLLTIYCDDGILGLIEAIA
ncbi:hypothetical protein [Nostoc sp.]|uniref:hypothetical protein n=1 Tax=Nostoc sp. TaxID=1180 RepID=UPI002FF9288D